MVSPQEYVPDRGDVVWIDMEPQAGHEQSGRRPALVVSRIIYNGKANLALLCPLTRQAKGYPFEVVVPEGYEVSGVILADQVRNMDWRARKAAFFCRLPESCVQQTIVRINRVMS